jgi:ketosteroid isomerase-like protein
MFIYRPLDSLTAVDRDRDELLPTYFRCLDTEDWELMRTLWHPDATMLAVGTRPRVGIDDIIEFFSTLFAAWPAHEDRPTRTITAEGTSTVEVLFLGTTADGRTVQFEAVDVFDVDGGRIRKLSNWYDIAYVRRALAADAPPAQPSSSE